MFMTQQTYRPDPKKQGSVFKKCSQLSMRWNPPLNKHHQASPLLFLLQLPHHLWQAIDSKAVSLTLLLKESNMKSRVNSNHNIILTLLLQVVAVHAKAKKLSLWIHKCSE